MNRRKRFCSPIELPAHQWLTCKTGIFAATADQGLTAVSQNAPDLPMVAAAKARDAAARAGLLFWERPPKMDFAVLVTRREFRESKRIGRGR